ncbi:MAG: TonB-dependent receptor [Candidatus Marinimicrobia bacterium]|nr:TonB-dependent receptor [Candidatus Neomarinimicrobiota bacterium]
MQFRILSILLCLGSTLLLGQSIHGFVREDANGEPLFYVNVFIKDSYKGAATNQDGYYVIPNVPPGDYEVIASIIGYQMKTQKMVLGEGEDIRLDFRLDVAVIAGEEVNVSAERIKFQKMVEPSRVTLDMREINAAPAFIEADLFRTLQLLPGVQTTSDFSSALYVRGSTPDQNLIMLDGITIYNPYHLGGLFSTFNTDAIKEADFHAGGFPARYGGRMGSILNVINREGNTEEFQGKVNISLLSAKGLIEGPIKWNGMKGSYMLAGRRTYFDVVANTLIKASGGSGKVPYYFYDFQGKVNLDINEKHRLTYSQFYGDDVLSIKGDGSSSFSENNDESGTNRDKSLFDWRWGNHTNSLTWRWIKGSNLILKTFAAQSRFRFNIDLDNESWSTNIEDGDSTQSYSGLFFDTFDNILDRTLETELTWIASDHHTISSGGQFKSINFDLGMEYTSANIDTSIHVKPLEMKSRAYESAFYIQDKWTINDRLSTQFGLRLSHYSLHGNINTEPRLGLKYFIKPNLAVKFNWGRYYQYLTIANPRDESLRFIDIWMGTPEDQKAPYSDHTIAGLEYITPDNIIFRLEGYYKSFDNMITLKQGSSFKIDGNIQYNPFNEFYKTDAHAYGLEFLVKKNSGKYGGWIGYTWAQTKWFTEIDGWFRPNFDKEHTLNMVGYWQRTERTKISSSLTFSSGLPFTPIQGSIPGWTHYQDYGNDNFYSWGEYLVGEKNSQRYPSYLRLDLGITQKTKSKMFGEGERYIQVLNLTNHLNHLFWIYRTNSNEKSANYGRVQRKGFPMFPLMVTFGLSFDI